MLLLTDVVVDETLVIVLVADVVVEDSVVVVVLEVGVAVVIGHFPAGIRSYNIHSFCPLIGYGPPNSAVVFSKMSQNAFSNRY